MKTGTSITIDPFYALLDAPAATHKIEGREVQIYGKYSGNLPGFRAVSGDLRCEASGTAFECVGLRGDPTPRK